MNDRDKVIKGLECCAEDSTCDACPYDQDRYNANGPCALVYDTLALLKAQEPRVMTIGDLYGEDMGYYERKDEELVWPVLTARGGPNEDGTVVIVRKDAFEIKADCGLMNITWRIWTTYPTVAQREATPWD